MGAIIPASLGIGGLIKRDRRKRRDEKSDRRSAQAEVARLQQLNREIRASGPQSSLRAPASDGGQPRVVTGGVGTSLLSQETLAPPFQRRR